MYSGKVAQGGLSLSVFSSNLIYFTIIEKTKPLTVIDPYCFRLVVCTYLYRVTPVSNLSTNTIINLDMLLGPEKQQRHLFDLTTEYDGDQ